MPFNKFWIPACAVMTYSREIPGFFNNVLRAVLTEVLQ